MQLLTRQRQQQQVKIRDIFKDHWEDFWRVYRKKFPKKQHKAIEEAVKKMLECGDISKGYYHYKCVNCGKGETKVGFSCKSRFCPRCGRLYTEEWLEKTSEKIANVEHSHLIFTIPEEFREIIYWNREILKELADLAVKTIEAELERQQKKAGKKEKLMVGIILVIHTFGRDMKFNPHFHILLANLAIGKKSGEKRRLGYLSYRALHKVWQYKFLGFMQNYFGGDSRTGIRNLVSECWRNYREGFYVNVQEPMDDATHAIFYIGRYLGRPAIAEYRIVGYDGQEVTFWYKDHQTNQQQYMTLSIYNFIARLVQHIPLKNFQMVRRYGFYARHVGDKIKKVVSAIKKGVQQVFSFFVEKKKWRERRISSFGKDPLICPYCGEEMELWQIWHPKYGLLYDFIRDDTEEVVELPYEPKEEQTEKICQLLMPFMQADGVHS